MIELRDVSKVYKLGNIEVRAIDGVNLEIEKGEFLTVMGPSGSGKSTLMNIIGCLDRPTSGEYCLEGRAIKNLSSNEQACVRLEKIGFIFQTFNLLPRLSALENVGLPLLYAGVNKNQRKSRALCLLESVGLADRLNHKPSELSGGERQRVAIARCLVNNPAIILADEPTGNIDSKASQHIMELLKLLNKKGVTILLVTHNQELARYSTRMITSKDGRMV
ncbi:ABC transporter ATP-binding protein [bacterium]|nr:ABC transporter ATP-binding protein [bacterium]